MAQGRSSKIISMMKWVRTSRLSTKNCLSGGWGLEFARKVDFWKKEIQTPMAQGRTSKLISMMKWIRTSRLSTKNCLSGGWGLEFARAAACADVFEVRGCLVWERDPCLRGPLQEFPGHLLCCWVQTACVSGVGFRLNEIWV